MNFSGKLLLPVILAIAVCASKAQGQVAQTLKYRLLKDVKALPLPDTTRYTSTFYTVNENPEIIATMELEGFNLRTNAIVASRYGKGIVVAVGSLAYFQYPMLNNPSVEKLVLNTFQLNPRGKIGFYQSGNKDLENFLKDHKIKPSPLPSSDIASNIGTLYVSENITDSAQLARLAAFVKNGGTLIFASPYEQLFKQRTEHSEPVGFLKGNDLLAKAGIINVNMLIKSTIKNNVLSADSIPPYLHINTILPYTTSSIDKGLPLRYEIMDWFVNPTLALAIEFNPYNSSLSKQIRAHYAIPDTLFRPSLTHPLNIASLKQKTAYRLSGEMQEKLLKERPELKGKAFGIDNFPGAVPDSARRVDKTISVTVQVGKQGLSDMPDGYFRPHSTGLYVPAGEKVKVILPEKYFDQKLKVLIGVHDDDLVNVADQINRIGFNLVKTFELASDTTEIYSPYGGLLELAISDTTTLKKIDLRVLGAVNAPYFKLGETDEALWNSTIKNYAAPWAELATDKIVFTVPSYRIRDLKNPAALLKFYDQVMDADADLRTIDRNRVHTERIIVDQQVAYGALFTMPYKIVAPDEDESTGIMLSVDLIKRLGSWGLFHELGHRHQFWELDYEGLGEVTVNLYSMYIFDQVLKLGKYHNHDNIPSKEGVIEKIKTYMRGNPSYDKFKNDPWIALSMYIQIIEQFGWDAIKASNKVYADLPRDQYPANNEQKIDLWYKTICTTTQSDMADFFDTWKIPVSASAKAEIRKRGYAVWLPEELKEFRKRRG